MVGETDLPNAIALGSAIFNLARVLGPAPAGLLIAAVGTPAGCFLNAATYGRGDGQPAAHAARRAAPGGPRPRHPGQLREGFAYVGHRHVSC